MMSSKVKSPARGNKWILFFIVWIILCAVILQSLLQDSSHLITASFTFIVGMFVPVLIYLRFTRQTFKDALAWRVLNTENTLLTIVMSIAVVPMMFLAMYLLSFVFRWQSIELANERTATYAIWIPWLTGVLYPSIFEELMYRGVILNEYHGHKHGVSIAKTAIISGVFFGLKHMNLHQAIYAALVGILLAYMMYYTRSVIAPILSHALINATFVLSEQVAILRNFTNGLIDGSASHLLILVGISLAMIPVLLICLKKLKAYYIKTASLHEPEPDVSDSKDAVVIKPKVLTWAFWAAVILLVALTALNDLG